MTTTDPALAVRLRRSTPYESEGYRRQGRPGRFRYLDTRNRPVPATERERIEALAIPPAWTNVWISASGLSRILAVGEDDAGRRQYIYHPAWRAARDHEKFIRARRLALALPAARGSVTRELRTRGTSRARVLAAAFRILDTVALRVGGEHYALTNGSRGLTTLQRGDVAVRGQRCTLSFPAKSGQRVLASVVDAELAAALRALGAGSGRGRIFRWPEGGGIRRLHAEDINRYIAERTGGSFTAKDFRTLRGTVLAAAALSRAGPATTAKERREAIRTAVEEAARSLGNTPAVARASYIDPEVFARYERGELLRTDRSPERALLDLLGPS